MQIELTPAQNSFAELGIQEGRFQSRHEAVRQALALWEKRERERLELLSSLDSSEHALDAGEGEEYSSENLGALADSVRKRGNANLNGD